MSDGKQQKWSERIRHKYRMVVMNDDTLEERFSFILSELNLYVIFSTVIILLSLLLVGFIVLTPAKEYIPGYGDTETRRRSVEMGYKMDSLEAMVHDQATFISNIQSVLRDSIGNQPDDVAEEPANAAEIHDSLAATLSDISQTETDLRSYIERTENYELFDHEHGQPVAAAIGDQFFFPPIKGYLTSPFDPSKEHFGIDFAAPENEPVKAVADGMIIFDAWTLETGYVIAIQHGGNLTSFYKHNSVLLKKTGNFVKAGDVIAFIGGTGEEHSTGPHLHFELWHNQAPVNPADYVGFY